METIESRSWPAAPHVSGTRPARHFHVATFDITEQDCQLGEYLPFRFSETSEPWKECDVVARDEGKMENRHEVGASTSRVSGANADFDPFHLFSFNICMAVIHLVCM